MASTIKVDNVQNQPGTNIINKCSTTITIGASSDTVALASGATQTGFGRTGTVDWVTTPKVTGDSPVTAVTGKGYFLNTTAGTITINLPAGVAGSIVSMADYAATWQTYNVTVAANGSEKIGGVAEDVTLNTEGQSVTLVYVDGTQGWVNTMDSTSNVRALPPYVIATGGTIATVCTNYKTHTFTGPGTFCVTSAGNAAPGSGTGSNLVDYMVIAGGGGGGSRNPGNNNAGGGAGGYRESPGTASGCYAVSPLGVSPAVALSVLVAPYSITVGSGGAGGTPVTPTGTPGVQGATSTFSTISSAGGGYGADGSTLQSGGPGGSGGGGGGGGSGTPARSAGGTGNTPPVTPVQGTNGGTGAHPSPSGDNGAAGGGGAICAGSNNPPSDSNGGNGGTGATSSINGTPTQRAGGGGAGSQGTAGTASGGGGTGGSNPTNAVNGTDNTGGGGGGGSSSPPASGTAGIGGSGIVIIRYKFQN
jgi:hypothetical protein